MAKAATHLIATVSSPGPLTKRPPATAGCTRNVRVLFSVFIYLPEAVEGWFPSPLRDPDSHPISRLARHRLDFGGAAACGGSFHEGKLVVDRYHRKLSSYLSRR
jgi:hypothetical protein